jgi:phosphocarrier protein FPr
VGALLSRQTLRLGCRAGDKTEAIRQAGALLVGAGHVTPAYVEGMLAREAVVSTYLGNGVALPHGRSQDRSSVHRAGLSLVQLPDGVEWDPGETAYLVIAVAARGDEHLDALARVSRVLEDENVARELARTKDGDAILARLDAPASARDARGDAP